MRPLASRDMPIREQDGAVALAEVQVKAQRALLFTSIDQVLELFACERGGVVHVAIAARAMAFARSIRLRHGVEVLHAWRAHLESIEQGQTAHGA